jgi:flagellar basal body-associated protein FliL
MSYIQQTPQLLIFLIVLAVLFVIVIVVAAVALVRRRKAGLTVKTSTYGNDVDRGRSVEQDNTRDPNSSASREVGTESGSDRANQRR